MEIKIHGEFLKEWREYLITTLTLLNLCLWKLDSISGKYICAKIIYVVMETLYVLMLPEFLSKDISYKLQYDLIM